MSTEPGVMVITGTSRGIGRHLAEHYAGLGWRVFGCARSESDLESANYQHHCLDVADEAAVKKMFAAVRSAAGGLDVLVNNAGIAAMNHALLTPLATVERVLRTNVTAAFLFCREAARLMQRRGQGRIVNFTTIAVPLKLEGEATYAASKAAVITLTEVLARELAPMNITVNAVGPAPVKTDLTRGVPEEKLQAILRRQAIQRYCEMRDIVNVIDFFIRPESDYVTGQTIFLGGV